MYIHITVFLLIRSTVLSVFTALLLFKPLTPSFPSTALFFCAGLYL